MVQDRGGFTTIINVIARRRLVDVAISISISTILKTTPTKLYAIINILHTFKNIMQQNKKFSSLIFILFLIIFPTSSFATSKLPSVPLQRSIAPSKDYVKNEVIIKYKDTVEDVVVDPSKKTANALETKNQLSNVEIKNHFENLDIIVVKSDTQSTQEMIKELEKNDNVEYAEPNYKKYLSWTPNDYSFSSQWAYYNTSNNDIDSTNMWDVENSSSTSTIVAVIDTGINYSHADLSQNYVGGYDFIDNDNDPDDSPGESSGHGTMVSSVFSATTNNSIGIAGISRYNKIKVMALRFKLDTASEIAAIEYATVNGIKVINASFAGSSYSQNEKNAIAAFPGIFVTASGNNSLNVDSSSQYPCNYALDNIICVGASNETDKVTSFSNYGPTNVDIVAPGSTITVAAITSSCNSTYCSASGTSFATPFVAGTVAMLYAHKPTSSISTIKNTLLKSSDHTSSIFSTSCSRRLNINNSLRNILSNTIPTEICPTPILRLYNTKTGVHLYTRGVNDRDKILDKYPEFEFTDGNPAFWASLTQKTDFTAIYRLYNTESGVHLYTRGETDRDKILNKYPAFEYTDGGPAFWAKI